MRKNKGITLIAVVITIIILLILAGISIATLTGKNGVLNKVKEAKEATEINNDKGPIELTRTELKLQNENYVSPTIHQMKEALIKKELVTQTEFIIDEGTEKLKLTTKEGYIFYITETATEYKGKDYYKIEYQINSKEETGQKLKVEKP